MTQDIANQILALRNADSIKEVYEYEDGTVFLKRTDAVMYQKDFGSSEGVITTVSIDQVQKIAKGDTKEKAEADAKVKAETERLAKEKAEADAKAKVK